MSCHCCREGGFQIKEKTTVFFQKKTEKRKPVLQGRREGMSSFPVKSFYLKNSI
jgi:hypothetical protein